jgi:hypothetical protein
MEVPDRCIPAMITTRLIFAVLMEGKYCFLEGKAVLLKKSCDFFFNTED